ncbi:MAG: hypothetical protein ACWA44_12855, partial [Thiotrichales bacterium]
MDVPSKKATGILLLVLILSTAGAVESSGDDDSNSVLAPANTTLNSENPNRLHKKSIDFPQIPTPETGLPTQLKCTKTKCDEPETFGAEYFVSPLGNDTYPGSQEYPFKTLEHARNSIRQLKASSGIPEKGIVVWLLEGVYELSSTFVLENQDSGEQNKPIFYKAWPGSTVRIVGSQFIAPTSFSLVSESSPVFHRLNDTAKENVVSTNLRKSGVTDYGIFTARGFGGETSNAPLELYRDQKRLPVARWPDQRQKQGDSNDITGGFVKIDSALEGDQFSYFGNRPESWTKGDDIW